MRIRFGVPQKKVRWIYTRGIITMMTNLHSFWDWTIVKFPRDTMRTIIAFIKNKQPISFLVTISCPYPTSFRLFLNFTPKSFGESSGVLFSTPITQIISVKCSIKSAFTTIKQFFSAVRTYSFPHNDNIVSSLSPQIN